jgi:DNA-binding transcriptional ArsR family regulator
VTAAGARAGGGSAARLPGARQRGAALALLKAIAHDGRLAALAALARRGPMPAGALGAACGLEQSAMSHQLAVLKRARLVVAARAGKQVIYALADRHVATIVEDALAHAGEPATSRAGSARRRRTG